MFMSESLEYGRQGAIECHYIAHAAPAAACQVAEVSGLEHRMPLIQLSRQRYEYSPTRETS